MKQTWARLTALLVALCVTVGLLPVLSVPAKAADNTSQETAIAVPVDTTVNVSFDEEKAHYFSFRSTKPGQFVTVTTENLQERFYIRTADGTTLGTGYNSNQATALLKEAETYYLSVNPKTAPSSDTMTVTLTDNDGYELNNSKETAARISSGEPVQFSLAGTDSDWFAVETTKAGQDIQIDISGFTYANTGYFYLEYEQAKTYQTVSGNGTYYFHASEPGLHAFRLYEGFSDSGVLSLTMTATVLDGDQNEPNDTQETATGLALGTDETFVLGGMGDEDWFQFEVAPNSDGNNLYTLQFLDLNPDYSDQLFYAVYAPDGSLVTANTYVNIHHTNILACEQQGLYAVRIGTYGKRQSNYSAEYAAITRAPLRIRVSEGGSDPFESNDTWLTAAPIQVGQLTQHVLASTADADWFYFTAPEADMSFALKLDQYCDARIYRAEDLADTGYQSNNHYFSVGSSSAGFCKLDDAGVYYVRMTTSASYVSEELRSFTLTLSSAGSEENNDTWDRATPLYESAPQSFDLPGSNDTDWFKLVVPEGAESITFNVAKTYDNGIEWKLYREKDILNIGLSAAPLRSWDIYGSEANTYAITPGTYYLQIAGRYWYNGYERTMGCSIRYTLSYADPGTTMESAIPLAPGVWSDSLPGDRWYDLGTLNSGDVVRFSREASGGSPNTCLYNSAGERIGYSDLAYNSFSISADDTYYLQVNAPTGLDANQDRLTGRIRYDLVTGSDTVTEIEVAETVTLSVGEVRFLDMRMAPYTALGGSPRLYQTENGAVAAYSDKTGCITAVAEGTTTMTFRVYMASGSVLKTITVEVVPEAAATAVSIGKAPVEMTLGTSAYLTASLSPADATEAVIWTSSDPSVLYVFPGGKVVAVGEGTAAVTAAVGAGSDSKTITVVPTEPTEDAITSVRLDKYALTLYMGEGTQTIRAAVLPEGIESTVTWTSSNTAAATVDQNGAVTAVGPGISIITAAAGDHNASCIVTVQAARVRVSGISFPENALQLPLGGQTVLLPTITPSNATVKTLTWVSDDNAVATVSRTGIVHALAVGVTTIRATTMDGGFTAEMTIEVTAAPQSGDVNGDGYIDSADAMMCLRSIVGLLTLTEDQVNAADVNHDGDVDAGDAVRILRYDAKLIDSLE